jgi:hypothetical protein
MAGLRTEALSDASIHIRNARHAISDLFLDTELQDSNYQSIARRLLESGLPLTELDRIYSEEVAPALHKNLNVAAGVWTAFDASWLDERIDRKKGMIRILKKSGIAWFWYEKWVTRDTISDWNKVREMLGASGKRNA